MSWITTLMQGGSIIKNKKSSKRNSMRSLEDLYDDKTLDKSDYIDLKGNLLDGHFAAYRDILGRLISFPHPNQLLLEALHIKAQQLANYKEQMEQQGGEGDEDDDDEDDDEDDDDDDEGGEDEKGTGELQKIIDSKNCQKSNAPSHVPIQGGGGRFAATYGPDYAPRYRTRDGWR